MSSCKSVRRYHGGKHLVGSGHRRPGAPFVSLLTLALLIGTVESLAVPRTGKQPEAATRTVSAYSVASIPSKTLFAKAHVAGWKTSRLSRTSSAEFGNRGDRAPVLAAAPTESSEDSTDLTKSLDTDALVKYGLAVTVQMSIFFVIGNILNLVSGKSFTCAITKMCIPGIKLLPQPSKIPFVVHWFMFYAVALKSRVFNPLQNTRPQVATLETDEKKRIMPKWTPPGFVFPIVWLLLIANLRSIATTMIVRQTESYATPAMFALLLHLSIGDVWNTINNVERRYGASVVGVYFVWLSKALASFMYYSVNPRAGKLLSLSLVWLTIASALVTQTWRLNPMSDGKLDQLYPTRRSGESGTKFLWFSSSK
jgi:translocator protein